MEKIKLQVSGSQIQVLQRPAAITAGMVGLEAEFAFDSHWDTLGKTVIFRAGDKVITAALVGDTYIVPWEVLERPDLWLSVGVYGANLEGTVVIPTLWTKVAAVYTGVDPEGDPALEPANPIWQETLARVADMEPQLQEHIQNTDNPHGVSCDQIGAVTQEDFWNAVRNLDGSGDSEQWVSHLLSQDNPHGVTAAQTGAAPAGYGLGERAALNENWNAGYFNSFVRGNSNSPNKTMWYGLNCVNGNTDSCASQIAFSQNTGVSVCEARRCRDSAGAWGQWEYVNPPMLDGVEYRTTERFGGKPVYTKYINAGAMPTGNLSKWVTVSGERADVIEVKAFMTRDDNAGYFPFPKFDHASTNELEAYVAYAAYITDTATNTAATKVHLRALKDMSAYSAHVTVKYTKNETA